MAETVATPWIALIGWIRIRRNAHARTDAVLHIASLTCSSTSLVAAHAVNAIVRRALRVHHAGLAILSLAGTGAIACTRIALIARIQSKVNRTARPVRSLALQCTRTCLARPGARGIATIAVHAEAACAICRDHARRAVDALAVPKTIAIPRIAFIARIGIRRNIRTRSNTPRVGARNACPETCGVATNAVNAIAANTLIRRRTRRTIGLLALAQPIAGSRVALIEWIVVRSNR